MALDAAPWAGGEEIGKVLDLARVTSSCPVTPSKIVCVGRNYAAHAAELGNEPPKEPLLFFKPPSSLLSPGGAVLLPPESERVDYEGELAVVIGKRARRVEVADALEHVFGYAVACDVTARDLQKKDGQWTRAKGFDTFCPIGPYIVTDVDPAALTLSLSVNGDERQHASTSDMVFDVATLVAYISAAMTLEAGDVILTGTPEGVGPLSHGDRVAVSISGLGELAFDVRSE
jgi:2-keto-4-pentenoate hydratase/2-oxohepta-3-ene-1,7-dioic acid hydratase in catechol pathway